MRTITVCRAKRTKWARSTNIASVPWNTAGVSGAHGLPLMGTGDWNDGMNRVGAGGKGESVWLGWFLIACLRASPTWPGSTATPRGRRTA